MRGRGLRAGAVGVRMDRVFWWCGVWALCYGLWLPGVSRRWTSVCVSVAPNRCSLNDG